VTIPLPTGTAANDLLLAHVSHRQNLRGITPPIGWTPLEHEEALFAGVTGSAVSSAVFWKRATAAEPASATFSLAAGPSVEVAGAVAAYSGVHLSTPINASDGAVGNSPTAAAPSLTTTVPGAVLVQLFAKRQETLPAPAGADARWGLPSSNSGNAWVGASGADEVRAAAGATGVRNSSASTFTSEWVALAVALRPALGAPSASLAWTASTSSDATGYRLERVVGAAVQAGATVDPVSANAATDGPLANGTAYTYRLRTYSGTWTSPDATVGFTPSC
jgi:hypothetical protein